MQNLFEIYKPFSLPPPLVIRDKTIQALNLQSSFMNVPRGIIFSLIFMERILRQKQEGCHEFQASLGYIASFRVARSTHWSKLCSQTKLKHKIWFVCSLRRPYYISWVVPELLEILLSLSW